MNSKKKNWFKNQGVATNDSYDVHNLTLPLNYNYKLITANDYRQDVWFNSLGTKLFVSHYGANGVSQYNLTTAWDISTAVFINITYLTQYYWYYQKGFSFNDDGTLLFFSGQTGYISTHTLTTAWDISTAVLLNNYNITTTFSNGGIFISPDGTNMFLVQRANKILRQYNLSTAWNVSTNTLINTLDLTSISTTPENITFSENGMRLYICATTQIAQYNLTTAWDISTAILDSPIVTVNATGMFILHNIQKVIIVDRYQHIREYNYIN